MELRHLHYFVAVAQEGSFTTAAGRRLHSSQTSLSRQMRDLEFEVGTALQSRSILGVDLTLQERPFSTTPAWR
jgi:LysR family hca operon transcriptional activator